MYDDEVYFPDSEYVVLTESERSEILSRIESETDLYILRKKMALSLLFDDDDNQPKSVNVCGKIYYRDWEDPNCSAEDFVQMRQDWIEWRLELELPHLDICGCWLCYEMNRGIYEYDTDYY